MKREKESSAAETTEQRGLSNYASAYDSEVRDLLEKANARLVQATTKFSIRLFRKLSKDKYARIILKHLTPSECVNLQHKHAEYLCELLSPTATADTHFKRAVEIGRVHELVGLRLYMLFDTYHLYQREMQGCLKKMDIEPHQRERLDLAIRQRLILDLEGQITSHYQVDADTVGFLRRLDLETQKSRSLSDLLRNTVSVVAEIHGVAAGLFLRPDVDGHLLVEVAEGQLGPSYAEYIEQQKVTPIHIAEGRPGGGGPGGRAWRSGQIVTVDSADSIPELAPWASAWDKLGFRSSATIPLLDHNDRPFALLALYSFWRGVFATPSSQLILHHIQQTLSHAVVRYESGMVIPLRVRSTFCRLLAQNSVETLYQPIIDLKTGSLYCVEALARLRNEGGELIPPGKFLPALGGNDLLRLFKIVVKQAGEAFSMWRSLGLEIPVSINLPPEGFVDDGYRDVLYEALSSGPLTAANLRLELLESGESTDLRKRDARIMEFRNAGITIVQDDLGAGHSSLLRMEHIPFDAVKIDQGLVRGALQHPQRALEFICHLTRLAHGFSLGVTVEGLENLGLVEAAAVLGADRGQGFHFGRPMSAANLPLWRECFNYTVDSEHPKTLLGALANYFLWDQQLSALSRFPEFIEPFVRHPGPLSGVVDRIAFDADCARILQSRIDEVLANALKGSGSGRYRRSKRALIETLGKLCLTERDTASGGQIVAGWR